MKRHIALVVLALCAFAPAFAQVPRGWMVRIDRSTTGSDPDAPGGVKMAPLGAGFRVSAPQAAVFWNPANTASGSYSLKGTFTLIKSSGYLEYYGLIFGGSDLGAAGQDYLYFVITDDGTWLLKRRKGATTEEISDKTPSPAIKKPDTAGTCTNVLEVGVMTDRSISSLTARS